MSVSILGGLYTFCLCVYRRGCCSRVVTHSWAQAWRRTAPALLWSPSSADTSSVPAPYTQVLTEGLGGNWAFPCHSARSSHERHLRLPWAGSCSLAPSVGKRVSQASRARQPRSSLESSLLPARPDLCPVLCDERCSLSVP